MKGDPGREGSSASAMTYDKRYIHMKRGTTAPAGSRSAGGARPTAADSYWNGK
jgi:hypothetical protein